MAEPISFKPNDSIKFEVHGTHEETGKWILPGLRERTYIGVTIVEKNGQPIPPTSLEIGYFDDEWDKNGHRKDPGILSTYWTATLTNGIPRAQRENAGQWSSGSAAFLDLTTLQITAEPVPVDPAVVPAAVVKSEPPRNTGWWSRLRGRSGQGAPSA